MTDTPVNPEGKGAILAAMLAVMEEVNFIEKDSFNPHGKYNYASEQAIKTAVRAALLKNGLIFQLDVAGDPVIHRNERVDNKGEVRTDSFLTLTFKYTVWHVSGQHLEGTFIGSGNARDDKGSYAAITGAIKYILTSLFLIPTGMDAEADGDHPAPARTQARPVTKGDLTPPPKEEMVCPKCGKKDSIIKGKEEYGGGYVCWKKSTPPGCGFQGDKEAFLPVTFKIPPHIQERLDKVKSIPVGDDEPPWPDDDDRRNI